MVTQPRHLRPVPAPPDQPGAPSGPRAPDWLALGALLVGLIPIGGFALLGTWSQGEIAVGLVLALAALRCLCDRGAP